MGLLFQRIFVFLFVGNVSFLHREPKISKEVANQGQD